MSDFKDLTLLIITPDYPDEIDFYIGSIYVKNQVKYLKSYFKKIVVICPILMTFKIMSNDKYCNDYSYDNVSVFYPRCFFVPRMVPLLSYKQKLNFDFRYHAIKNCIENNDIKFDLIHSHFTYPSSYCAALLKEKYNVPYVATINEDSGWLNEEVDLQNPRMMRAWANANKLITINTIDVNQVKQYNRNTISVPYGFDPKIYYPRDKLWCRKVLNVPQNAKILFTFGVLQERKGFEYLIESMNTLKEIYNIHCYIGGKSVIERSYEGYLKELVKTLHLEDRVHFIGFLETPEIPIWINACDLLVISSLEEGFGITQIEALGCGKPVIATDTNGSLDIITNSDVGILCNRSDSIDLARGITDGLVTNWDSNKIVNFSNKYHQETIVNVLLDIYKEVLNDY